MVHRPGAPTLDGEESSYFEWLGGGWFDTRDVAGAMHQVSQASQPIVGIRYGYDAGHLYSCAVPKEGRTLLPETELVFSFPDADLHLVVGASGCIEARDGRGQPARCRTAAAPAWTATVELQVPLAALAAAGGQHVRLSLALRDATGADFRGWTASLTGPGVVRSGHWRA